MKLSAELDQNEIKEALKAYVEQKTGGRVVDNGIRVNYTKADPRDPREQDHISATVKYEKD